MARLVFLAVLAALCFATESKATEVMRTSWYNCCRTHTTDGLRFSPHGMTAAHKTLPFGTVLELTNPKNGRTTRVTIHDRGPFKKGRDLDVTEAVARKLGMMNDGVVDLLVTVVAPEPGEQS